MRATTLDFRVALRVLTSPDAPPGEVLREGGEIVIRVPGVAPEALALPALEKPLGAIRLVREPGLTILRVEAAPEVPFEASHEPGMLTVVFGEQPAPELRGPVTPDLYERLFPTGAQGTGAPEGKSRRSTGREETGSRSGASRCGRTCRSAGWTPTCWPSTTPSPCATSTCRWRPA